MKKKWRQIRTLLATTLLAIASGTAWKIPHPRSKDKTKRLNFETYQQQKKNDLVAYLHRFCCIFLIFLVLLQFLRCWQFCCQILGLWKTTEVYLECLHVDCICFQHFAMYEEALEHSVWKSQKKSHSIRAKWATFTFVVDKSSLKNKNAKKWSILAIF